MAKFKEFKEMTGEKKKNKGIAKAHQERKRAEAIERWEKHCNLSLAQRMEKLDKRLGKGIGAKKERMRLKKLIDG